MSFFIGDNVGLRYMYSAFNYFKPQFDSKQIYINSFIRYEM